MGVVFDVSFTASYLLLVWSAGVFTIAFSSVSASTLVIS